MQTKLSPKEFTKRLSPDIYRSAYKRGMSLSAWLNEEFPQSDYNDGLDAFERLLAVNGIRTQSLHGEGLHASKYEDIADNDNLRVLLPEFFARIWRKTAIGRSAHTRDIYASLDDVAGSINHPYADAMRPRWDKQIAPAIPLSELVGIVTAIDTDAYRAYYLTQDESATRLVRVGEGAEIPRAKLQRAEKDVQLYKFGRVLEATYEQLRRQRLDKIALHVQQMAVQAESDKVSAAIDVLVNGDGNSNPATVFDLTTLDGAAAAGTLTLKGWLAYKLKFANPYALTTALLQEDVALQMLLLNTGSANVPLVNISAAAGFGGFTAINPGLRDNVAMGWTADAPALKVVGFDSRFALEYVYEIGSDISETERFTTRQTQTLTMTEVGGFAVLDRNATKILNINA